MNIVLRRRLALIGFETTGTDPLKDHIVQIGLLFIDPDGSQLEWQSLIDPVVTIPTEATAIHGITNEAVKGSPTFLAIASNLASWLIGCDIGGFSVQSFDLPMLVQHFKRCGIDFPLEDVAVVDVAQIYHKMTPRNLAAAYKHYTGEELIDAHDALVDIRATRRCLEAQIIAHQKDGIPAQIELIQPWTLPEGWIDPEGRLKKNSEGVICLNFGKHAGKSLKEQAAFDPSYLQWILTNNFPAIVKTLCEQALAGTLP